MADEIRTLKAYMEPITFYASSTWNSAADDLQTIPLNANFVLAPASSLAGPTPNQNAWVFDDLTMTIPDSADFAGGVSFACYNQQRIDLTGYLQTGSAIVPMGSASQRASVPQLPGRWDTRYAGYNLTYMRDYTIWSVEPLTQDDITNLYSTAILRTSITPNMPSYFGSTGGSMTTTQMLSSQTRYYTADSSVSSRIGWLKELFNQQGGMGESAASPHVYCTRVIAGQMSTPSNNEVLGATGSADTNAWSAQKFFLSIPASWEILNVGVIEPDELEYLTFMQRSVLAPVGRTNE